MGRSRKWWSHNLQQRKDKEEEIIRYDDVCYFHIVVSTICFFLENQLTWASNLQEIKMNLTDLSAGTFMNYAELAHLISLIMCKLFSTKSWNFFSNIESVRMFLLIWLKVLLPPNKVEFVRFESFLYCNSFLGLTAMESPMLSSKLHVYLFCFDWVRFDDRSLIRVKVVSWSCELKIIH